jgi:hypothetical protein
MLKSASLKPGDVYLEFNGREPWVEIPGIADYSASTTGELAIFAWPRPIPELALYQRISLSG